MKLGNIFKNVLKLELCYLSTMIKITYCKLIYDHCNFRNSLIKTKLNLFYYHYLILFEIIGQCNEIGNKRKRLKFLLLIEHII